MQQASVFNVYYNNSFFSKELFMQKTTAAAIILLCSIFFSSCVTDWSERQMPSETEGYVPVYSSPALAKTISGGPARPTINGGKLYTVGNLLFQVEQDSGIHVINYADRANPQKLGFIRSILCKELSVKNGFIYTNNLSDLVVIDINDINNVKLVARTEGVFPDLTTQYPPRINQWDVVYFECPDPKKGVVVGWKLQTIKNPKCWR
jgi:hypothetical protein